MTRELMTNAIDPNRFNHLKRFIYRMPSEIAYDNDIRES